MTEIAREPLVHFLLLAVVILIIDQKLLPERDPTRLILVDQVLVDELREQHMEGKGRYPTVEEMDRILLTWVQNEVMYREAVRLGLDQGDDMFRNRLVLKIRNMLISSIVTPEPTEGELRAWFEQHPERFQPARLLDIEYFEPDIAETDAEAAARRAVTLASDLGSGAVPEELQVPLRQLDRRPEPSLAATLGPELLAKLTAEPAGRWVAGTYQGRWHLARIVNIEEPEPVSYEDARFKVKGDWEVAKRRRALFDEITDIRNRYEVRLQFE
jgi:hypothetical protein